MSVLWKGIRYQTGEIKKVAEELKKGKIVEMDLDFEEELDEVITDLEEEGIYKIKDYPYDYNAIDLVENPEFMLRAGFYTEPVNINDINEEKILFIDFFMIEEQEEDYDEIFWG